MSREIFWDLGEEMANDETIHSVQFVTESGKIVTLTSDKPWPMFEGRMIDATFTYSQVERGPCICNVPENRDKDIQCPQHGGQRPHDMCPLCKTHVLGGCAAGEYCTAEDCDYVA